MVFEATTHKLENSDWGVAVPVKDGMATSRDGDVAALTVGASETMYVTSTTGKTFTGYYKIVSVNDEIAVAVEVPVGGWRRDGEYTPRPWSS